MREGEKGIQERGRERKGEERGREEVSAGKTVGKRERER